jgi:hypothetical protein
VFESRCDGRIFKAPQRGFAHPLIRAAKRTLVCKWRAQECVDRPSLFVYRAIIANVTLLLLSAASARLRLDMSHSLHILAGGPIRQFFVYLSSLHSRQLFPARTANTAMDTRDNIELARAVFLNSKDTTQNVAGLSV